MDKQRTQQQNRALHLFYTMLAEELNNAGLDQRKVLKPSIDIPWTLESVKNQLWRPIQEAMLSKKSTTELESKDIDKVYEVLMRHLGQSFGITVMFPSEEELTKEENVSI
jgi:hypothetical protein